MNKNKNIKKLISEGIKENKNFTLSESYDVDPISSAKTSAKLNHDFEKDAIEYAGEDNWNGLTPDEKEQIISDLERDFDMSFRNESKTIKITQDQLQKIIKEGVENLHRKTMLENRLEQINNELNMLSNPEAWDNAKQRAQEELEKKNINWTIPTERQHGLISEKKYSDAAQDYISKKISKLDDEGKSHDQAVAIAINMARDKGMKVPAEPKENVSSSIKKEKNPEIEEAVADIMERANNLMNEAQGKIKQMEGLKDLFKKKVSDEQAAYNEKHNLPKNWNGTKEGYHEYITKKKHNSGSN